MRFAVTPFLALLLAAPVALTGCSKDASNVLGPQAAATSAVSDLADSRDVEATHYRSEGRLPRVMFVHASPDAPPVDIRVGWFKTARNLAFPSNTRYKQVFPGLRRVRVNVAGTTTTVIDAKVPFQQRKAYSIFAIDRVANIAPLVLTDDLTAPAKGNAHVRFVHLSPNAPPVDVALDGGSVVFRNKAFKDYTEFTPLPAGDYDLEVRVAGTEDVALDLPVITLEAGKIYTVFAKGLLGGSKDQALGAGIIVNADKSRGREYGRDEVEPVAAVD